MAMREQAARVGAVVNIISPSDLDDDPETWGDAQEYFPLAVETRYSAEEMLYISNAVLFHGVRVQPVGTRELWNRLVPTELPELLAVPVCSVDEATWYTPLVRGSAPRAQVFVMPPYTVDADGLLVVNATKIDTTMPSLAHPLATLKLSYIVPDVVIGPATPDDVVMPMYSRETQPESSPQNRPDWVYMLIGGVSAVVLLAVGIFVAFV